MMINPDINQDLRKRSSKIKNGKAKDPDLKPAASQSGSRLEEKKIMLEVPKSAKVVAHHVLDLILFIVDLPYYIWHCVWAFLGVFSGLIWQKTRKCVDGETILITGAAAGLGQEAVLQLARISPQATYVLWDINEKGLLETQLQCEQLGASKVYTYVVDLSKYENVVQTAAQVRKEVGHVTILFNNAGLVQFNQFLDMSPVLEEKILQVNLLSYMWTIREFLPGMIEKGKGHIVSTCSGLGHMRFRYLSAYVASKHGLKGFLDCLKLEMSIHPDKPDIKFSTIYPGWVKTNMTTGITWTPRYKTWKCLQQLDSSYVAEQIIDGILKEKEDIMVPGPIYILKYFYGLIPPKLMNLVEAHLMQDIKIVKSSCNSNAPEVVVEKTPPGTPLISKPNENACGIAMEPSPTAQTQTATILMPTETELELEANKTRL